MEYDNELRGVLFKNDRKQKDTHADYTGNCQIEGRKYWISAWLKEGQKGKFFSFSFKPADGPPAAPRANSGTAAPQSAYNRPPQSPRPQPTEKQLANQTGGAGDSDIPFARIHDLY